jgi:hypothetical protein
VIILLTEGVEFPLQSIVLKIKNNIYNEIINLQKINKKGTV